MKYPQRSPSTPYFVREGEEGGEGQQGEDSGATNGIQLPDGFTPPSEFSGLEKFFSVTDGDDGPSFDFEQTSIKTAIGYKELQSRLGEREEETRGRVEAEVRAEMFGTVPADVSDYKAEIPKFEGISVPDGWEVKQPEGPETDAWQKFCHEKKLGQGIFQEGIDMLTKVRLEALPPMSEVYKEIGDNAKDRMKALGERITATLAKR